MDQAQAIHEIRRNWRDIITSFTGVAKKKSQGEETYICPFCRHGENGDGLKSNPKSHDGNGLKCFVCGFSGDIIDFVKELKNCTPEEAREICAARIGITIDKYNPAQNDFKRGKSDYSSRIDRNTAETAKTPQSASQSEITKDYTEDFKKWREQLSDPAAVSYLSARGISIETAREYWIGYDAESDPAGRGYKAPRMIIPTGKGQYVTRAIDPNINKQYAKMNSCSEVNVFNQRVLYADGIKNVFVTEGAFDALSILEVGEPAIALNSASNAGKLIELLKREPTKATLIICMDSDQAGENATERLKKDLQSINAKYVVANINGGSKDPNDALVADKEKFKAAIADAYNLASAKPDSVSYYISNLMAADIERFRDAKSTGFTELDKLAGGLYPGLYAVAALTSLGKTTFCHQIADQLAAAGNDVLFFSLEQSKLELVSKSIARTMAKKDRSTAVSSLAIRQGYLGADILAAARDYQAQTQDRLNIIEGNFNCNVSFIGNYIRRYIEDNGTKPVVFIDYLQILQPEESDRRQTTKDVVDNSITELKRMSRDLNITIFVICSVNRANYLTPIDFESIKESGGIEYTCDVIWGLQLQCLNDPIFDKPNNNTARRKRISEAKSEKPRKIELHCLKNRYGISEYRCNFDYYCANELFVESKTESSEPVKKKTRTITK